MEEGESGGGYLCYACNQRVTPVEVTQDELTCGSCGAVGFVEKLEDRSAFEEAAGFLQAVPEEGSGDEGPELVGQDGEGIAFFHAGTRTQEDGNGNGGGTQSVFVQSVPNIGPMMFPTELFNTMVGRMPMDIPTPQQEGANGQQQAQGAGGQPRQHFVRRGTAQRGSGNGSQWGEGAEGQPSQQNRPVITALTDIPGRPPIFIPLGTLQRDGARQQDEGGEGQQGPQNPFAGAFTMDIEWGPLLEGLQQMGHTGFINFNDYVIGDRGLDEVMQYIAQNDPNQHGNPPAAKDAVKALPEILVTGVNKGRFEACAVCRDSFDVGQKCLQMPCGHAFCKECLTPWLERHNTCPTCRFELRTDDPDYERRRAAADARSGAEAAAGSESSSAPRQSN